VSREKWSAFEERLESVADSARGPDDSFDVVLMLHEVRLRLFEMDSLRVHARDPRLPLGNLAGAVYGLLARDYAPQEERVEALVSRLNEVPGYLDAGHRLLENPPRVLVEQALSRADAVSTLLLEDLPAATSELTDSALTEGLSQATQRALKAVWRYREQMVVEVLPRAASDFALGPDLFSRYVHAAEDIDLPLSDLRQRADAEIEELEAEFRSVAGQFDSTLTPAEVMFRVSLDHPDPESILVAVEDAVVEAEAFLLADGAFPMTDLVRLEIRPTPGISRWAHAGLAAPGPFETHGFSGVFYITLPDPRSPVSEQEEHLRFMSRPILRNLTVHEAYPGHGLQASALSRVERPVRRAVWSSAFVEGWAHYAEYQMMERGYREEDVSFRVATLQSALRRAGRFRVALGLHTEGWTLDMAVEFLEERSYLEPTIARREAKRGMVDPLYLVYTVGRLEIESLREEMERIEGEGFDVHRFHERLLGLGAPPLPLARARFLAPEVLGPRFLD
jgi:uncharacterized protein (DUF885 family)